MQSGGTRDRGVNIVSVPTKSGRLATMLFALSFSFLSERFSLCLIHSQKKYLSESFLSKRILELKCCLGSGIFTSAVERGIAPHTRKQRVLAAISKLSSAYFTGYKNKNCTYCTYYIYILGMCSFQHKWASERQLYLFVLLHHVIMK